MKKIFLYLILFLFIAGLATLAYGFWNAKNIRGWARTVAEIKSQHDISASQKNIEEKMNASGGKTAAEFNEELAVFVADLGRISRDLDSAGSEMQKISTPRAASRVRTELFDYYQKSGDQVKNIASVAEFMKEAFDVTAIFDKMKPDATAEDVRAVIADAKEKSGRIDEDKLPEELEGSGIELKTAVENYLDEFNKYAIGETESREQLDAGYTAFSGKVNDFLIAKKSYFGSFQDIDSISRKIDNDLMVLEGVKFSLK
jgi:hypothetical protein